jgi:hypothetical protein
MQNLLARRWIETLALVWAICSSLLMTGCNSRFRGQSLPPARSLVDEVHILPGGPETQLPRTRHAHVEYRALQASQGEY